MTIEETIWKNSKKVKYYFIFIFIKLMSFWHVFKIFSQIKRDILLTAL